MRPPLLDHDQKIHIPLVRAADLQRVGAVASHFAELLDRSIEVVSVIDPEDNFATEFRRFADAVEQLARASGREIVLRVVSDALPLRAVLAACSDRLVCMATAASPFDDEHYVGSFAAAVLSDSTAPVILVGPHVNDAPDHADRIVVAVSKDIDAHAALAVGAELARTIDAPLAKIEIDPKGVVYESDYFDTVDALPDEMHASMIRGPLSRREIADELVNRSESAILVLATRAQRGLAWICEGSVAFDAIGVTRDPVVAVGPRALEEGAPRTRHHDAREIELRSPDAMGAAVELDERIRFLHEATSATFTAQPLGGAT